MQIFLHFIIMFLFNSILIVYSLYFLQLNQKTFKIYQPTINKISIIFNKTFQDIFNISKFFIIIICVLLTQYLSKFMEQSTPDNILMKIKTFTHDYYHMQLPPSPIDPFYKQFPYYVNNHDYKNKQITSAPIARIYGTNQFGQKCCCHIHGYFPFFYIKCQEFSELLNEERHRIEFLRTLEDLFQKAHKQYKPVIYRGSIEEKYDFYGYHTKKQSFLRIYVYEYRHIRSLCQLLASKAVSNKSFQAYEAHISFFMKLFSQTNLYGIHEMKVCGFTFRGIQKDSELLELFQKMHPSLTQGIMTEGWNLSDLHQRKPEYFNSLYKMSTCYIEIDLNIESILNSYEPQESQNSDMDSSDEQLFQNKIEKKMKVKITKALQQIWQDQRSRRRHLNIKQPVQGIIDYSNNIQASQDVKLGLKDPLYISFYRNHKSKQQIKTLLKSYFQQQKRQQMKQIFPNRNVIQNYYQDMESKNTKLVDKVVQRFKFYGKRKEKMISEMMKGERSQLPEWQEDEEQDEKSSSQSEKQQSDNQQDSKSQMGEKSNSKSWDNIFGKKKKGNTALYRGNFQVIKAKLKNNSMFEICRYCKKSKVDCQCILTNQMQIQCQKFSQKCIYSKQNSITFQYKIKPPTQQEAINSTSAQHQEPYFSNMEDLFDFYKIPKIFSRSLKYAQYLEKQLRPIQPYNMPVVSIRNQLKLPYFWKINAYKQSKISKQQTHCFQLKTIQPPTVSQVLRDVLAFDQDQNVKQYKNPKRNSSSVIDHQETFVSDLVILKYEFVTEASIFCSNPEKDQIKLIVFQLSNYKKQLLQVTGAIMLQQHYKQFMAANIKLDLNLFDDVILVKNQRSLILMFVNLVIRVDADLLVTFDQQQRGIYYLVQRGFTYGMNLSLMLSRAINNLQDVFQVLNFNEIQMIKQTYLKKQFLLYGNVQQNTGPRKLKNQEYFLKLLKDRIKQNMRKKPILRQNYKYDTIHTKGRVNFNIYRICEQQIKSKTYTLCGIVKKLFNVQLPQFLDGNLIKMYANNPNYVLDLLMTKLQYIGKIMLNFNMIGSIVEKSKIYGADFVSMMERGSQFKIESIMCRVTKSHNYLNLSASKYQVANQAVMKCMPFVYEAKKQLYCGPVLLFDFQSLYPSVMIAYNLCYSTCLGSITQKFKNGRIKRMGVSSDISMDLDWLQQIMNCESEQKIDEYLNNHLFITPNGVVFVRKNIRQGIIPRILLQFLISRIMIKESMKFYPKEYLQRLLKERQIALKLFMNVMFGYTGANFSGRMPCMEIADSVIDVSKYCLRRAIQFLTNHHKFKGNFIYGDTDSIFFHLPDLTVQEAFKAGEILAKQITALFPYPMQMKFQKVYESLVLVSKKRYFGKCYEKLGGQPKFDGKGLQTVRRDGIDLVSESMQDMLKILMNTKDLTQVKQYFRKTYSEAMHGLKLQYNFALSKQVKLLKYSQKSTPAHGEAAKRLAKLDPSLQPKYGQRMKFILLKDGNIKALKNRSMSLLEMIIKPNDNLQIDIDHYMGMLFLNPLQRAFRMVILQQWTNPLIQYNNPLHKNIFRKKQCLSCDSFSQFNLCFNCLNNNKLDSTIQKFQKNVKDSYNICKECTEGGCTQNEIDGCVEMNCKNIFRRKWNVRLYNKVNPQLMKLKSAMENLRKQR